jgi:tRNA threonylcarbamoyladenosine biosynthesis protein TsaE
MIVRRLCSCERGAKFIRKGTLWQVFFEKIFAAFSRHISRSFVTLGLRNMMQQEWQLESAQETEDCAFALAQQLTQPVMIALIGPMGAGKTHFAKGFARGLGHAGDVTSPTFSIVQEYHGGRFPLFHFDLYRIKSAEEVIALGWDDYLDQDAVLLVEWADLFPEIWPRPVEIVSIEILANGRKILYQK